MRTTPWVAGSQSQTTNFKSTRVQKTAFTIHATLRANGPVSGKKNASVQTPLIMTLLQPMHFVRNTSRIFPQSKLTQKYKEGPDHYEL